MMLPLPAGTLGATRGDRVITARRSRGSRSTRQQLLGLVGGKCSECSIELQWQQLSHTTPRKAAQSHLDAAAAAAMMLMMVMMMKR